jgi:TM2 domain-containing membrane protein YozV
MHRFYLGYWRTGLAYIVYLVVTLFIEFIVLDQIPSLSWEAKENISLGFTGFIWVILFIDVFLIRGLIDKANEKFSAVQAFN